uniref:Uncharacterized protein n=2 Tax=Phlebotomus papatasi TaxID=29031 RepID=A0A1B0D0W6_PHLPP
FSILLTVLFGVYFAVHTEDCQTPKHYSEIGCQAILQEGDNCPKRFDCETILRRTDKECFYQGLLYNEGDNISENITKGACQAACFCRDGTITCANIECPELFGTYKKGCIPQNNIDDCCASDYICAEEDINKLPLCYMNDREYRLGEKIHISGSCYICICANGFDNTTKIEENPHCQLINCGLELHSSGNLKAGCTPIYYKKATCCPIGWRCPNDSDKVIEAEGRTTDGDPNMECTFGNLKLKVGNQLSTEEGSPVICECSIPPMVTCIQNPDELQ